MNQPRPKHKVAVVIPSEDAKATCDRCKSSVLVREPDRALPHTPKQGPMRHYYCVNLACVNHDGTDIGTREGIPSWATKTK